jgi:sulfite exporter TauE/SafE
VGGLGQVIGFSGLWRGIIPLIGGVFMIVMAVNLLDFFPALRRVNIRLPLFFAKKIYGKNNYGPFFIGLLTGLMPCGPLQMMQIYALGTKSVAYGAAAMFVFALGSVPLMFLFGILNTFLNKKFTRAITRVSAALVLVLGIVMLGRGLALAGVNVPLINMLANQQQTTAVVTNGAQIARGLVEQDGYPAFIVQKGIPVELTLVVTEENLNDCNNALTIPKFKIDKDLVAGENVITFTPLETGVIPYTCWMGMIKSTITVVEDIAQAGQIAAPAPEHAHAHAHNPVPAEEAPATSELPEPAEPQKLPVVETPEAAISTLPEVAATVTQTEPSEPPTPPVAPQLQTWTGWLFDRDCIGVNPIRHPLVCNLMDSCYDSGLGIIEYAAGKSLDSYTEQGLFLNFDAASKLLATEFLQTLPKNWKNNITVKVTGYTVTGIPTDKKELHVPEADSARIDHYLDGIHITEIEAAFIDGISTNSRPE